MSNIPEGGTRGLRATRTVRNRFSINCTIFTVSANSIKSRAPNASSGPQLVIGGRRLIAKCVAGCHHLHVSILLYIRLDWRWWLLQYRWISRWPHGVHGRRRRLLEATVNGGRKMMGHHTGRDGGTWRRSNRRSWRGPSTRNRGSVGDIPLELGRR